MLRLLHNPAIRGPWLLALLALAGVASAAPAQSLQLRNETGGAVVIQTSAIVRGALRRERPALVLPGDMAPPVVLPGNKILTIYDARTPNRILFQGVIPASMEDQFYGILLGTTPQRVPPRTAPLLPQPMTGSGE